MFANAASRSLRQTLTKPSLVASRSCLAQSFQRCRLSTQEQARESTGSDEAPKNLAEKSDKSFFGKMLDKYSVRRQTNRILVAESFLQAANHQASDPRWFGPGRIATDFRSYQALLTMHIWFLHKRLISNTTDPHAASLIQEELFDIFWTDTMCRMRYHGVNEWVIQKNLKTVQQYTFMHCFHYDHCYTELLDKPQERYEELRNLVARHVLLLNPDGDADAPAAGSSNKNSASTNVDIYDDHLDRLVWYIETQYQNIVHDIPSDSYNKARVSWVDLPDFSGMVDNNGKALEEIPINTDDLLPKPWVRNIANDGQYYYWNLDTRQATWERPKK